MTLQEFEARGQDYADLRDALREIATLKAVHVELLSACKEALRITFTVKPKDQPQALIDFEPQLRAAIAKARKEVS